MKSKTKKDKDFDKKLNRKGKKLLASVGCDECKRGSASKKERKITKKAVVNPLRKEARINIRISNGDLERLKQKAAHEGLPYQTLIASILHKYVAGR